VHLGACFLEKQIVYLKLDALEASCPKLSRILLLETEETKQQTISKTTTLYNYRNL